VDGALRAGRRRPRAPPLPHRRRSRLRVCRVLLSPRPFPPSASSGCAPGRCRHRLRIGAHVASCPAGASRGSSAAAASLQSAAVTAHAPRRRWPSRVALGARPGRAASAAAARGPPCLSRTVGLSAYARYGQPQGSTAEHGRWCGCSARSACP
jgi:hypothetical protein